jgi:hypothetical protein
MSRHVSAEIPRRRTAVVNARTRARTRLVKPPQVLRFAAQPRIRGLPLLLDCLGQDPAAGGTSPVLELPGHLNDTNGNNYLPTPRIQRNILPGAKRETSPSY